MIFVTVGTTFFDELIKEVDKLVGDGIITEKVIMQIGSGKYKPKNTEYFRYAAHLEKYYGEASIVITHAAAGTLFTLLRMNKRILAVTNPRLKPYFKDDYRVIQGKKRTFRITSRQMGLPMKLEEEDYLVWCPNTEYLSSALDDITNKEIRPYTPPKCTIPAHIEKLLNSQ